MRDGWSLTRVREIVRQVKDTVQPEDGKTYRLLGVRWYGMGSFVREEVTTKSSKATRLFAVTPGDFVYNRLFAWKGSFGVIPTEQEGCFVSGEFPLFRPLPGRITSDYLNLYMCQPSVWSQIEIESTGSTSVSRNRWKEDRFLDWEILLPPLDEQKRIVDVVASVDTYIDALKDKVEKARAARNAVLHELLSAGGPDWTETTLGAVAEVVGGGTPATGIAEYWGGDIVWLTPTEVASREGQVLTESERKITLQGLSNSGAKIIPAGSVILTSRATVGFVAIAGVDLTTNQGFQSLVPNDRALARFLMMWIQANRAEFESRSAGSTFKEISKSNVKSIPLALPPLDEQERRVDIISSMDDVIAASEKAVAEAVRLRSGLLSDLLSGEHEIPASYDSLVGVA